MKQKIHPKYVETKVTCGCGVTFTTRSTIAEINVEVCSSCHPFYTGKAKFVDTAGRVEKFQQRFAWKDDSSSRVISNAVQAREAERKKLAELEEKKRDELSQRKKQSAERRQAILAQKRERYEKKAAEGEAKRQEKAEKKKPAGDEAPAAKSQESAPATEARAGDAPAATGSPEKSD